MQKKPKDSRYFKDLISHLGGKENSRIEYKLSRSKLSKDIWETVSSFSNESGGLILLGYEERGNRYILKGVGNAKQLLDDFSSTIGQKFNYCPRVDAENLVVNEKDVIAIEVNEAPENLKPIYIKALGPLNGGFKRVGASDIRLTDEDIRRYYMERTGTLDSQPVKGTSLEDIDSKAVRRYKNLRKLVEPEAPEIDYNDIDFLRAYSLLADESETLTVAGLILFGTEVAIKRYFPSARLDIIRIKGIKWGKDRDPFLTRDFKGNLLSLRSIALDFLDRFFLIPFHSNERGDRVDENAHRKALRELLTNLLMHQNYHHSRPAQIIIYNDRVDFYNPGYSLKDPSLFKSPGSELRNPLIAAVFYDINWAETKGTGLKTTMEALESEGYPLPLFNNDTRNDIFTLTLPHPAVGVTPHVTPQVTPQVERMDRITTTLKFCDEPKALKEIMEFLNLKDRKYFMDSILNPMLKRGYLTRTIPDKPRSRLQKYIAVKEKKGKKVVYNEEKLKEMGLNERQIKAVMYMKEKGRITNREYRELFKVSNKTAYIDFKSLVKKDILIPQGKGKSAFYILEGNEKVMKG